MKTKDILFCLLDKICSVLLCSAGNMHVLCLNYILTFYSSGCQQISKKNKIYLWSRKKEKARHIKNIFLFMLNIIKIICQDFRLKNIYSGNLVNFLLKKKAYISSAESFKILWTTFYPQRLKMVSVTAHRKKNSGFFLKGSKLKVF